MAHIKYDHVDCAWRCRGYFYIAFMYLEILQMSAIRSVRCSGVSNVQYKRKFNPDLGKCPL